MSARSNCSPVPLLDRLAVFLLDVEQDLHSHCNHEGVGVRQTCWIMARTLYLQLNAYHLWGHHVGSPLIGEASHLQVTFYSENDPSHPVVWYPPPFRIPEQRQKKENILLLVPLLFQISYHPDKNWRQPTSTSVKYQNWNPATVMAKETNPRTFLPSWNDKFLSPSLPLTLKITQKSVFPLGVAKYRAMLNVLICVHTYTH